jgi:acid phosphatase
VIVVFENQDYTDVVGSASMPYWNQLATQNALATQFYANVHPSMGNYFLMTAGSDPSAGLSNPDAFAATFPGDNAASVLTGAGKTWKVYAQSLPSTGYIGGDVYPYFKHHNPFAYFDTILNSSSQAANMVDFTQLTADIGSGSLPSYSFIVPDAEHDGHDCPQGGTNCPLADRLSAIDNFLSTNLAPLLTNSTVMANTIFIATFDESANDNTMGGGRIPVLMVGGPVKKGFQSTIVYQEQNLLRFSLESLGLSSFPGAAQTAAGMNEFLK